MVRPKLVGRLDSQQHREHNPAEVLSQQHLEEVEALSVVPQPRLLEWQLRLLLLEVEEVLSSQHHQLWMMQLEVVELLSWLVGMTQFQTKLPQEVEEHFAAVGSMVSSAPEFHLMLVSCQHPLEEEERFVEVDSKLQQAYLALHRWQLWSLVLAEVGQLVLDCQVQVEAVLHAEDFQLETAHLRAPSH